MRARFQPIVFRNYLPPNGFLNDDPACHALFYYYLLAMKNYQAEFEGVELVYEGDRDPVYNYRQLFSSIAMMYSVEPERMIKFWTNVDMQVAILGMPKLPMTNQYRFEAVPEIRTQ